MTTSTSVHPSVATAFGRLVDYAGLFPPAKLAMEPAVAEYDVARGGTHVWMLGRFIVPASRIDELLAAAVGRRPIALSVIVDADLEPRQWLGSVEAVLDRLATLRTSGAAVVEALEVPLPRLLAARDSYDAPIGQFTMLAGRYGLRDLPLYIEPPRDDRWRALLPGTMMALARARCGAKLRCGGVVAQAFPSIEDVAAFIHTAVAERVPFKATAGLHHPVRHLNEPTGFVMHGFLNLLAAAAVAHRVTSGELESIVAEEDAGAFGFDERSFHWRNEYASMEELCTAREHRFVGYGSCSFSEPVDDLTQLSILPTSGA